ncbi:MAG: RNase adapter RapZ [Lachnospirales bacterium]
MNIVIVTGMSGAGKSATLKFFEDFGYYCIDNLPPLLITNFLEVCKDNSEIINVAIGVDVRGGKLFNDFLEAIKLIQKDEKFKVLFLESSDDVLIKRFKESRRAHPLGKEGSIKDLIHKEREILKQIKQMAEVSGYIIDTSKLLNRDLKEYLASILEDEANSFNNLVVSINSFGFKFGIPQDSDLVFDVRFIPNPFYVQDLKEKTGQDVEVQEYVMSFDESVVFLNKLKDMVEFLIPYYIKEGKNLLVINIGCTGGKHRSVTIANKLYEYLHKTRGKYNLVLNHINIQHKK